MLKTLTVWNFALLEHVEINFAEGLNILTGETGAGKSILIDAIGAVLGHRLSGDVIRTGCDWLRVEAIFDIAGEDRLHDFLASQAIDDEDDVLIITRQITTKGKNVILVNGCHTTVSVLRAMGEHLIDIHGQHENLALVKTENQFALLDGNDAALPGLHADYAERFHVWRAAEDALAKLRTSAQGSTERVDMLKWQAQEIDGAELRIREDEELEAEIRRLSNAERITENVGAAHTLLDGDEEREGILADVARLAEHIETLRRFDSRFDEVAPMLEDVLCQLKEVSYSVESATDSFEFDPQKLDDLQGRMDEIERLERKYGATIEDVLAYREKIQAEIDNIENYDDAVEKMEKRCETARVEAQKSAALLTAKRRKAAERISTDIVGQLTALGMPDAKLCVEISPAELTAQGADKIDILFTANVGEAARPLSKVASGGELSRIALAIKTVGASSDFAAPSMIFDEIDTGIGGKTAQMVAERIALVAAHKQVLCITHLPQIACMADAHYYLEKDAQGGKTITTVHPLTPKERVREIARMASGADLTTASLGNAEEMIARAAEKKKTMGEKQGG